MEVYIAQVGWLYESIQILSVHDTYQSAEEAAKREFNHGSYDFWDVSETMLVTDYIEDDQ
jgi:hypothetical protein